MRLIWKLFFITLRNNSNETVCGVCELAFPVVKIVPVYLGEDLFACDPVQQHFRVCHRNK